MLTIATGVLAFVTAVLVLITAISTWRTRKQIAEVHVLVNSRMAGMEQRVAQLTAALEGSDTPVPPVPPTRAIET